MIRQLYNERYPFAVCISTIEFVGDTAMDYYVIIPRDRKTEVGFKCKKHISVETQTLTDRDVGWFKKNHELFNLVLECPDGRVYEPKNQPSFKNRTLKIQHKLL